MPEQRVEIVPYDPAWPALATSAIAELREALPGVLVEVEHIGSTAVPGLAAKPVIDLMAAAADLDAVEAREERPAILGYRVDRPRPSGARAAAGPGLGEVTPARPAPARAVWYRVSGPEGPEQGGAGELGS